ncbi:MAG: winged helix-turn-helix domain-containing protein [Proteobacteria bacterium]|nr:winged helix-turn-helix domain-containing protein [Pseudomonadota bacterium]
MRGRPAKPIEGIEQYDFDKLSKSPKSSAREKLRFLALAHIKEGTPFFEVSKMLRVYPRTISAWVRKFREKGLGGLRDQYRGGAQLRLPDNKYEEFRDSVIALQASRKGGRIRGEDVRELLQSQYAIRCSLATVYNTLKRAKLVWITGRSQHPKADKEAQLNFKKTLGKKSKRPSQTISQ